MTGRIPRNMQTVQSSIFLTRTRHVCAAVAWANADVPMSGVSALGLPPGSTRPAQPSNQWPVSITAMPAPTMVRCAKNCLARTARRINQNPGIRQTGRDRLHLRMQGDAWRAALCQMRLGKLAVQKFLRLARQQCQLVIIRRTDPFRWCDPCRMTGRVGIIESRQAARN